MVDGLSRCWVVQAEEIGSCQPDFILFVPLNLAPNPIFPLS
jgi:hypothetical protein